MIALRIIGFFAALQTFWLNRALCLMLDSWTVALQFLLGTDIYQGERLIKGIVKVHFWLYFLYKVFLWNFPNVSQNEFDVVYQHLSNLIQTKCLFCKAWPQKETMGTVSIQISSCCHFMKIALNFFCFQACPNRAGFYMLRAVFFSLLGNWGFKF